MRLLCCAIAALDKDVQRVKALGIAVEVAGLDRASATLIESLGGKVVLKEV